MELNNNNNNNSNNISNNSNSNSNNNNSNNNDNNNGAEWKIQLKTHISYISTKNLKDKPTIHPQSKPVEIFVGSKTKDVIGKLFNTLLQRFQKSQETSDEKGSEFIFDSVELLHYHFNGIDIIRAES